MSSDGQVVLLLQCKPVSVATESCYLLRRAIAQCYSSTSSRL